MTLGTRLGVAGGLVLAVLVAVGVLLPRTVRAAQLDEVDRQVRAAGGMAIALATGFPPPPRDDDKGSSAGASALSDLYVARIDPSDPGERQVRVRPTATSGREPELPTVDPDADVPEVVTVGSVSGEGSWRAMLLPLQSGPQVLVAMPLDRVDATVQRTTVAILVAAAALLVAMAAAGWWLLRLGLGPIAEVTQVADAIAGGDRSRRVREGVSGTEADHLARAFNVMLDEQAATEEKLRQFVADASHELRTPVAAIGGFADLWREGAIGADQLDDVMRRIGQESVRMRGLVEDLLLLARLDQGQALALTIEPVDLAALAADAVLDASATRPSRQVSLHAPEPVLVQGDEDRLRQVVANLVSNALVHTDATTTVEVRAEMRGDAALLSVSDDGPGMTADVAARAFDRFWRADPSRARAGAGLGLSIVRSIVAAHHGWVRLDTTLGAGTTVRVALAASPDPEPARTAGTDPPQETRNQRSSTSEVPA